MEMDIIYLFIPMPMRNKSVENNMMLHQSVILAYAGIQGLSLVLLPIDLRIREDDEDFFFEYLMITGINHDYCVIMHTL